MQGEQVGSNTTPGAGLWRALDTECPLQVIGVINAYAALLAQRAGFRTLYLSGAGVANASYGLPDLAMTTLNDVLEDTRRITSATALPLLVDIDTGWGGAFMIARTIKEMIKAGAAGVHIEDQIQQKRCGHRPNKVTVSTTEMVDRIKVAVDARTDPRFVIIARTDALASEGLEAAMERSRCYAEAGADLIFPEAFTRLEQYQAMVNSVACPVLANMTEFGLTPLFTLDELRNVGVRGVLYPLSAFRAMSSAARTVYEAIRWQGTQKSVVSIMQPREDLYEVLGYTAYERKLDQLFGEENAGHS